MRDVLFTILFFLFLEIVSAQSGWVADVKGCKYFTYSNVNLRTISWEGPCKDGMLNGYGTLIMYESGNYIWKFTGEVQEGKLKNGTTEYKNGIKYVGDHLNGKRNNGKDFNPNGDVVDVYVNGVKQEKSTEFKDMVLCTAYPNDRSIEICRYLQLNSFKTNLEAQRALQKVVTPLGLNATEFILVPCNGIDNCVAVTFDGVRYIIYDNNMLEALESRTQSGWISLSILAHEIGHHIKGHTIKRSSNLSQQRSNELEADFISGYVLATLGASIADAQIAMNNLPHPTCSEEHNFDHPCREKRLQSIREGWNAAKNRNIYNNKSTVGLPTVFSYIEENLYNEFKNCGGELIVNTSIYPEISSFFKHWNGNYEMNVYGIWNTDAPKMIIDNVTFYPFLLSPLYEGYNWHGGYITPSLEELPEIFGYKKYPDGFSEIRYAAHLKGNQSNVSTINKISKYFHDNLPNSFKPKYNLRESEYNQFNENGTPNSKVEGRVSHLLYSAEWNVSGCEDGFVYVELRVRDDFNYDDGSKIMELRVASGCPE